MISQEYGDMRKLAVSALRAVSGLHRVSGDDREQNATALLGVAIEGKGCRKIVLGGTSEKISVV